MCNCKYEGLATLYNATTVLDFDADDSFLDLILSASCLAFEHKGHLAHLMFMGALHPADKSIVLQLLKAIEKGVRASPMELNPQAEGSSVLVPVPTLTQEVRQNMTKLITKAGEAAKVGGLLSSYLVWRVCMRVMELSPSSCFLGKRSTNFAFLPVSFATLVWTYLFLPEFMGRVSVFPFVSFLLWAKLRSEGVASWCSWSGIWRCSATLSGCSLIQRQELCVQFPHCDSLLGKRFDKFISYISSHISCKLFNCPSQETFQNHSTQPFESRNVQFAHMIQQPRLV